MYDLHRFAEDQSGIIFSDVSHSLGSLDLYIPSGTVSSV